MRLFSLFTVASTVVLLPTLFSLTANAQVNKGVLGHSNGRDAGYVLLRGDNDETIVYMGSISDSGDNRDFGNLQLKDGTGSEGFTRARLYVPNGRAILLLEDSEDDRRVDLRSSLKDYGDSGTDSYGILQLYADPDQGSIVYLGGESESPRRGRLRLRNSEDGLTRVHAYLDSDNNGTISLFNTDKSVRGVKMSTSGEGGNVRVRAAQDTTVGSYRAVVDNAGEDCGQLELTSTSGNSVLIDGCQGVKNAVMGFPGRSGEKIYYAAMEGPEVGLYTRGRGKLENGRAVVRFPDHFAAIISEKNLTVQLTPHSADTMGLAAVRLTADGLQVRELGKTEARGNFEFSYMVHGIRKGSEDYPVVRKADDITADDKSTETRDGDLAEEPLPDDTKADQEEDLEQ